MKERIKLIRKNEKMNQTDFGKQINLSQNAIASYENGVRIPTERVIADICRVFTINEEWLRNGTGEMKSQNKNEIIKSYIDKQITDNSALNDALKKLADMSTEEWNAVYNFIQQFKTDTDSK